MKRVLLVVVLLLLAPGITLGREESVSMPWTEFKKLYRESIERDIMKTTKKEPAEKIPQFYTLEEAVYRVRMGEQSAEGQVLVSGKVLSGDPEPIPLFKNDVVVASIKQVRGGSLLSTPDYAEGVFFLPDSQTPEFQLLVSFLIKIQEDSRSRFITFDIPAALRNSLHLKLSSDTRLLEQPGLADSDGVYHFSATPSLTVRFVAKESLAAVSLVEVDTFSRIQLQGKRAIIGTSFLPVRSLPSSLTLQGPEDAQYISSTLKASWIKELEGDLYQLSIPPDMKGLFSIEFSVQESGQDGQFSFALPQIKDNNGKEGNFVVEEPSDGQITLTGEGLVSQIPVSRLAGELARAAGKNRSYLHIPPQERMNLNIKRFQTVAIPLIVLDSQCFFTSFEENGNILSVLVIDIPPEVGPRMKLKSIADAQIWSLAVNGEKRKVYTSDDDTWIIPLAGDQISHVELAFLRKGEKLGLQGRLETTVPETGLPSRSIRIGIGLPERVHLLSVEGPVSPDPGETWKTPTEFMGKPYFFSRAFHKGEEMKVVVSYKEPVK